MGKYYIFDTFGKVAKSLFSPFKTVREDYLTFGDIEVLAKFYIFKDELGVRIIGKYKLGYVPQLLRDGRYQIELDPFFDPKMEKDQPDRFAAEYARLKGDLEQLVKDSFPDVTQVFVDKY